MSASEVLQWVRRRGCWYPGQWVALEGGEAVDADRSREALLMRLAAIGNATAVPVYVPDTRRR